LAINVAVAVGVTIDRSDRSAEHSSVSTAGAWPAGTFAHLTGSKRCIAEMHSKVKEMWPPTTGTLLKPLHLGSWVMRPVRRPVPKVISEVRAWWIAADGLETRTAQYRVFLARLSDDAGVRNRLSWVILDRGIAAPSFTWNVPLPHMPANAVPQCRLISSEIIAVDATTGRRAESGDLSGNPFATKYASRWRYILIRPQTSRDAACDRVAASMGDRVPIPRVRTLTHTEHLGDLTLEPGPASQLDPGITARRAWELARVPFEGLARYQLLLADYHQMPVWVVTMEGAAGPTDTPGGRTCAFYPMNYSVMSVANGQTLTATG
jgi:hypothetical protein